MQLVTPIAYQGGKSRIASAILDRISLGGAGRFYDLCCGSGAIAIELVNRSYPASDITMLDAGPWGLFWEMVGGGDFDLDLFKQSVGELPANPAEIKGYLEGLARRPFSVYDFLLLQAGSFGGKAIWVENGRWRTHGFRGYWVPTETSNRRHPVNPMMPMPATLFGRVAEICRRMKGVAASCGDVREFSLGTGVVYVDPPYGDTTRYGHSFNVIEYVSGIKNKCYVSEGRPLSGVAHLIAGGRKKGGISGERKVSPKEGRHIRRTQGFSERRAAYPENARFLRTRSGCQNLTNRPYGGSPVTKKTVNYEFTFVREGDCARISWS